MKYSRSHISRLNKFLNNYPYLNQPEYLIPFKYKELKRKSLADNLYLIDKNVAEEAAALIEPHLRNNPNQIVAETNAGLGLISAELLKKDVRLIRLYESCLDFRTGLKQLHHQYPGRVELFTKDIFLLHRYAFIDRHDQGNRVEQLLKNIPKKPWSDDPIMTIIGPMSNSKFLRFLVKQLIFQSHIMSSGRFQLFAFMRPGHYLVATAGPQHNLHTYQIWSVISRLFLDIELLGKFPRKVFLPWESKKIRKTSRFITKFDPDFMYLARINFKKELPVKAEQLLPLYLFIFNLFHRGTRRVIPSIEKLVPDGGLDIFVPKFNHKHYFKDMSIFTTFGELTPEEILSVFKEVVTHKAYKDSPFMAMVESQLLKTETIESHLHEHFDKAIMDDFEVKLS